MLPAAHMHTLRGPTPTSFTGDPAQAQHFLNEFEQLVRANPRHPFIYRPELRVKLVLAFIAEGLTTASWRRGDSGLTDETDPPILPAAALPQSEPPPHSPHPLSPITSLLDPVKPANELPQALSISAPASAEDSVIPDREKNDAATVSSPTTPSIPMPDVSDTINSDLDEWTLFAPRHELITAPIAPTVQTSTANIPSPSPADVSTLKCADGIPVALIVDEPPQQRLSEVIDLTAEGNTNDWSSFVPRIPLPRTYTYAWRRPIILPTPVDDSSGLLPSSLHRQTLPLPTGLPRQISTDHGLADAALRSTSSRNRASLGVALDPSLHPESVLRCRSVPQPSPFHYSDGLSFPSLVPTPLTICPPSPHDVVGIAVNIAHNVADLDYFAPLPLALCPRPSAEHSPTPQLRLSPHDCFHVLHNLCLVDKNPADHGEALQVNNLSFASPLVHSPDLFPSYPSSRPSSPADERPPPSLPAVINLTLDDFDDAADAVLFASLSPSPWPSPSLVPAPLLPAAVTSLSLPTIPSLFVVEDDNVLIEGVKTFETSVFIPDVAAPSPSLTYYPHIFLPMRSNNHETQTRLHQSPL
ncbi:hypothetical protein EDB85DRAFT_2156447 [Lactarius pseudohatsudake]|nr:hypothetical protein EDB85DRAFT_2156447 [Lactarius pseudohatsudake]